MRRVIGVTIAGVLLAGFSAGGASPRTAEPTRGAGLAVWSWEGLDSSGATASITLQRNLPGEKVDIEYRYESLCLGFDSALIDGVAVAADGSFAFHGVINQGDPVGFADIAGRFSGKSVTGTARAQIGANVDCEGKRATGEARFAAACEPCGGDDPAGGDGPAVKVVHPLLPLRVTPRLRANGLIAFVRSGRAKPAEIQVMNERGGAALRVTRGHTDLGPTFSPDGRRIAFQRHEHGRDHIYVVNRDGSGLHRLPTTPPHALEPDWSPDGKRIAFRSFGASTGALWVINADGTGQTRITDERSFPSDPTWSPDGTAIAFTSVQNLWVIEGAQARLLVRNATFPDWSPDGGKFAYLDGRGRLVVVGADGKGLRVLTRTNGGGLSDPAWSPDGRKIAINRGFLPHPYQELAILNAATGKVRRLTNNFLDDIQPTWAPR